MVLARALDGFRVLDLSRVLAGPWATQTLADLGADVIKVEHPKGGDDTRHWGPPFVAGTGPRHGLTAHFVAANRGKRSLAVDFSSREGIEILHKLVPMVDVVVENYIPGTLVRRGLGYEQISALNPALIYCSVSGYGQSGPMAEMPGYDFIFQGAGGSMSYTGQPEGQPGSGPLRSGMSVVDVSAGLYATSAIMAALLQRGRTGRGQHIDVSLIDVAVAINANFAESYLMTGTPPQRFGNSHPTAAPVGLFSASDGFLILVIGNDQQFTKFCNAVGRSELAVDERFRASAGRVVHRDELDGILAEIIRQRSRQSWCELLANAGVPSGPIKDLAEVFADDQVRHRGMRVDAFHHIVGQVPMVRNPLLYDSGGMSPGVPPLLGQHSSELLDELGYSATEIRRLSRAGVVGIWDHDGVG